MESDGRIFKSSFADGSSALFNRRRIARKEERKHSPAHDGLAVGNAVVRRLAVQWNQSRQRGKDRSSSSFFNS